MDATFRFGSTKTAGAAHILRRLQKKGEIASSRCEIDSLWGSGPCCFMTRTVGILPSWAGEVDRVQPGCKKRLFSTDYPLGHWVQLTLMAVLLISDFSSSLPSFPLSRVLRGWEACFSLPNWTNGPLASKEGSPSHLGEAETLQQHPWLVGSCLVSSTWHLRL